MGTERVSSKEVPISASEDFSYYLQERPGCFYLLGTALNGKKYGMHTPVYDYNDSMIATGALLFVKIVEDRLNTRFI